MGRVDRIEQKVREYAAHPPFTCPLPAVTLHRCPYCHLAVEMHEEPELRVQVYRHGASRCALDLARPTTELAALFWSWLRMLHETDG